MEIGDSRWADWITSKDYDYERMDDCLHIPKDFAGRREFRLLEKEVGKLRAAAWVMFLFRDLAYAAQHSPLGVLSQSDAGLLGDALRELGNPLVDKVCDEVCDEGLEDGPVQVLKRAEWITAVEGGYFCALFAVENKHFGPDYVSMQRLGGKKRGVEAKAKEMEAAGGQLALMLDPKLFVRPDGTAMAPDECRRVNMLIVMLDHHLGRKTRLKAEFTAGLIQDSYRVIERFDQEAILRVCTWLSIQRDTNPNHPALPKTTELVLGDFEKYVR